MSEIKTTVDVRNPNILNSEIFGVLISDSAEIRTISFSFRTLHLKVGDSHFLRDDECRHDTRVEISITRSGSIAIKFNYR